MNVLILSQALNAAYGGSAVSEATLSAWLKRAHRVTVLCRAGASDPKFVAAYDAAPVVSYQPLDAVRACFDRDHPLAQRVAEAQVFHLNGHWRWENFFFAWLCRQHRVPYVLHPRGMLLVGHRRVWLKRVFNLLLGRRIVRGAAAVIALSEFETKQFAPYRVPRARIVVLPNGIVPEAGPARGFDAAEGIEPGSFLYLGRLEPRKNLVFLLEAFAKLRKEGASSRLYLIGPDERGYAALLRRAIASRGLEAAVTLQPQVFRGDKYLLYRDALATIYPSYAEPFGRVPFEAIAAGGVPIVPDESGSAEYLRRFLPQSVYRASEVGSLLEVLRTFSERGRAPFEPALAEARKWIETELHWDTIARRTETIYARVTGK